jgi:hypothetical protein
MSDNNNTLIIVGIVGFLYLRSKGAFAQTPLLGGPRPLGAVPSMPGSAGVGLQQIATGAVAGFFQQLAKSPSNNTSAGAFQNSYYDPVPRGQIAQEAVDFGGYETPTYGYDSTDESWFS